MAHQRTDGLPETRTDVEQRRPSRPRALIRGDDRHAGIARPAALFGKEQCSRMRARIQRGLHDRRTFPEFIVNAPHQPCRRLLQRCIAEGAGNDRTATLIRHPGKRIGAG
jgi:hypothetical protein